MLAAVVTLGAYLSSAHADPSSPGVEERRQAPAALSSDGVYNQGIRARISKDWKAAENAFRAVISRRPDFPDAWNELGYALRNQARYGESLAAYEEALRLRPAFPEALEYLGEAYVQMGRRDDARKVLERLRPLDAGRASELAELIGKTK
jgi:tetratricopeptide (TPR) repeat protein